MIMQRKGGGYQVWLVLLLSLNFGILFFDRQAANFMMPYIQPDLALSNFQVGMIASGLSLTWAIAGLTVGPLSDRLGSRKPILLACTVMFCACSFLSGLAGSFVLLIAARLLMGVAEGGVMPVSHAMIVAEVKPAWRGLAMGVGQNVGSSLLGSTVAPLVLVSIAAVYGWRNGFFFAAIPGLITAALIWLTLREPPKGAGEPERLAAVFGDGEKAAPPIGYWQAITHRNVLLCAAIAVLLVSYLVVAWSFLPLFLVNLKGYAPEAMGNVMAVLGVSSFLSAFVLAGLSDRWGRKPVFLVSCLIGAILPLGALLWDGSAFGMAAIFFAGWFFNGMFPLFMATVPAESVDPRLTASLAGFVGGVGEVLGGVLSPSLAGKLADIYGLTAPVWFLLALTLLAFACSLFLHESAPAVLARRAATA
jgi:ACS family hexuronate transporter-like MFS transporter